MRPNNKRLASAFRHFAFGSAGVVLGWAAFSGHWMMLGLSVILVILINASNRRTETFVLALGYYLAASRGLPEGIAQFLGQGALPAILLWLSANSINALVHALFWSKDKIVRSFLCIMGLWALAWPPLGITGWASPLASSGILFPGLGFVGLILFTFLLLMWGLRRYVEASLLGLLAIQANLQASPVPASSWAGVQTLGGKGGQSSYHDFQTQNALAREHGRGNGPNLILPENSTLQWNPVLQNLWMSSLSSSKIIGVSAVLPGDTRRQAVIFVSQNWVTEYRQRQPVPFTMWKPWSKDSFDAGWFDNPVVTIGTQPLGVFICYESLLVWPMLQSTAMGAQVFLLTANLWWSKDTSIPEIQLSILKAWSRLFHIPYAVAVNL